MSSPPLSARRGSVSASDPYGTHAHLHRPSTSTLTIVRLPACALPLQEPLPPHKKFPRRSIPSQQEHPRLSFATSSFANGQTAHSPSGSPNTSPRMRPSSPHRFPQGIMARPRLSAGQIVDIAKQAVNAPTSNPQSPVAPHRPQSPLTHSPSASIAAPATFVPLPDDIYLPFIHRAEEVSLLISTSPTAKLFALLKQAFSNKDDAQLPLNTVPPGDPFQWSYFQLIQHLTHVDRDVCSDADWVFSARRCIMSHSELIWERVKAALGVPPELDVEEEECISFEMDDSAIIDSPVVDRACDRDEQAFHLRRRLEELGSVADTSGDADEQTPQGVPSPADNLQDLEDGHLTIEPLLSTSNFHPPPLSLPASLSAPASDGGLGDIAEGAEEEVEEEGTDKSKPQEEDLIDPSQIQGLRISNESVISSPVIGGSVSSSESSFNDYASPNLPATGGDSSNADMGESVIMGAPLARSYRRTRPASVSGYDRREWDIPYDPVAERGPGNPLFPSNFSRLALGPTLRANNPALRLPVNPPASRYGRKPRSQSWVAAGASGGSEYAVTLASESS